MASKNPAKKAGKGIRGMEPSSGGDDEPAGEGEQSCGSHAIEFAVACPGAVQANLQIVQENQGRSAEDEEKDSIPASGREVTRRSLRTTICGQGAPVANGIAHTPDALSDVLDCASTSGGLDEKDARAAKRRKGMHLGHARSAVLHAPRRLTRDSAHWCYFCKHIIWSGPATENHEKGGPNFCTLCGSKLLPKARDAGAYSRLAQQSNEILTNMMDREVKNIGGMAVVERYSHPGVGLEELQEQIAERSAARSQAARQGKSNSKFCDICGHGETHIQCSRCPVSFHKTCIVLPPNYPLPRHGWWCSGCMHEAIREGEIDPLPLEPRLTKRTLPSIAQHCSSCGYPEIESLNCDACCRWFCYGCMCVSHECVPSDEWACPECIGQKAYDKNLSERIKVSRERWLTGKMSTKERDGFSQLVFDLLCACAWEEWEINVEALITDNMARLARDPSYLPTILPFQSLHYPLGKEDMTQISQAYAKVAENKAIRAYRIIETRNRCAEEEEEVQRKKADEKGGAGAASDLEGPSLQGAQPRRVLVRLREGETKERDRDATPSGDETVKTSHEHADVMGGDMGDGVPVVTGIKEAAEELEVGSAAAPEITVGPSSIGANGVLTPALSGALPRITMWKPELCAGAGRSTGQRLKIGYMSSDFVNHPTADLIIRALLLHNNEEFETFCYSLAKDDKSTYRRVLEKEIPNFRLMPKNFSDRKCAEMIADDGIHILVNLNGHTAGDRNGISALRPAPLQIVYLAYPGTMGATYIDYNVVDKHVCPQEHREFYTERLLYMPHSYQANSFNDLYKEILSPENLPKRTDYQVSEDAFVFCNFCRLGRITQELFSVWMRILQQVPHGILWLYKHPRAAMYRLQEAARALDPSLVGRIIFAPPCSPKLEHLKRVSLADLCLDTTVYNGHTTGSDMLWAGVPMITVRGDNWCVSLVRFLCEFCVCLPPSVCVKQLSRLCLYGSHVRMH